ncbi:MAG: dehydrogenase [Lentisphaerae bacterium RIFOXYB12_FULL_65_16]|nr:MAG: dehydrogenase [Lentisphaerae bacterium RIFOXYA12_64_32]OGV93092.1 MAG: dehydrogenase [Lentisphaerae bacterium RIFOXYB12_FULL_65_16]
MARVFNWQIGREMSYWYPEKRPQKQFAAVFDINKCIACQTCTLACKTTWTSGKGQEYMLWNNVESKPYGSYPLAWDLKLLQMLGAQEWKGSGTYAGRTLFESAPAGKRVLGWRPEENDYSYPNVGEDDCAGRVDHGAGLHVPHLSWFFYLARICNHCTYPACLASCPRGSIYKRPEDGIVLVDQGRCRGYRECVQGCPYKKVFYNPSTGTSEKCIACFPKIEQGLQNQCFVNCIGKIRLAGWLSTPENANPDNPIDYLVHVKKLALPLFPQFGLEPNVYYIPPIHAPASFLHQMFGPGAEAAVQTYRAAAEDADIGGLLGLFGCTERVVPRWKRTGETVVGAEENGAEIVRVPLREPVYIRQAFDEKHQIARVNCP